MDAANTAKLDPSAAALKPESVAIADLQPHPRNYRKHPPEQIAQIIASLRQFGFYRNIVATKQGNFILAGHGVVQSARQDGLTEVPVIWLDLDPFGAPALKILAGDNELSNLAEDDDRMLAEILKDIMKDGGLEGTGYDAEQLTNLVFTATSRGELKDLDEAKLWVGMPEYERQDTPIRLILTFPSEGDRVRFVEQHHISLRKKEERCWSAYWPDRPRARPRDLLWDDSGGQTPTASAEAAPGQETAPAAVAVSEAPVAVQAAVAGSSARVKVPSARSRRRSAES